MSYIVLARRYRPQTFEDIVGQEPIVTTLRNAIRTNRVAHAYLLAGPRGGRQDIGSAHIIEGIELPAWSYGNSLQCL